MTGGTVTVADIERILLRYGVTDATTRNLIANAILDEMMEE